MAAPNPLALLGLCCAAAGFFARSNLLHYLFFLELALLSVFLGVSGSGGGGGVYVLLAMGAAAVESAVGLSLVVGFFRDQGSTASSSPTLWG